ncbi:low-density lipoprotein receptor-related protein 2-like isoform X2, partial [Biomphalaria glabrata]
CDDKPINLLIAIDEGATEDINIIINKFIKDFLKDLAVDGKNVIVWFLKYKDTVILSFNRTEVSKVKTLKAIDELKWESSPDAEFSDIVSFVNSKSQLFFGAHRQRARHILLLITLYLTKHNYKNFAAVTKIIKEKGMYIIAVGVNLENSVYLHFVASDPIEKNTFAVDASKDLNKIIPRLTSTLCEGSSLNGLKELTDKSAPTILISTTMPDDRISTLVSAASGSASNTAIIVSLVVLAILFISIAAYKFKEKLWCFSRNASRTPTISNNTIDQEYLDVDHYDYMSHYEVETGGRIKPQDKNTGNTKPVPQEDHYDNVDYTIENVSGYITPIDVVYNSTADR